MSIDTRRSPWRNKHIEEEKGTERGGERKRKGERERERACFVRIRGGKKIEKVESEREEVEREEVRERISMGGGGAMSTLLWLCASP